LTTIDSKILLIVISSVARNLLDSSTYDIMFLPADCQQKYFAAIWGFKRFLASLPMAENRSTSMILSR